MALFKLGSIVTECRGKLGGSAFQMNAGRLVALNSPKPRQKVSIYSAQVKRSRAKSIAQWRSLSTTDKESWNLFAKMPEARTKVEGCEHWSGFNWFIHCNYWIRILSNVMSFVGPPINKTRPAAATITGSSALNGNGAKFVYTNINPTGTLFHLLFTTRPLRQGHLPKKSDFIFLKSNQNSSSISYATSYTARFGSVAPAGYVIYFKVEMFDSSKGLTSIVNSGSTIIT